MKRPGARVRAIAARLCRTDTMARLVDPTLADLQAEHSVACRVGFGRFFHHVGLGGADREPGLPSLDDRTTCRERRE